MENGVRALSDVPVDFLAFLKALDDPDPWLPRWLEAARSLLGADAAWLSVAESGEMHLRGVVGLSREEEALVAHDRPRMIRGRTRSRPYRVASPLPALALPLSLNGHVIGLLSLAFRAGALPEPSLLLEAVALAAAQALGRSLGPLSPSAPAAPALPELSEELLEADSPHRVYEVVTRSALGALQADAGVFLIPEPSGTSLNPMVAVGAASLSEEWAVSMADNDHVAVKALSDGRTVSGPTGAKAQALGLQRALAAPVRGYRSRGALVVLFRGTRSFTDDEQRLLSTLGCLAAVALDRVHLAEVRREQAETLARMGEESERRNQALRTAYDATLAVLGRTLELRSAELSGHTSRVVGLSLLLGQKLGLPTDRLRYLKWGAYLHDIGKIGIPDAILAPSGPVSEKEKDLRMAHPRLGYLLVKDLGFLDEAREVILHHHERWDGKGYPDGREGRDIPLLARIFAVVDAFDAMTRPSGTRTPMTREEARAEIRANAGRQFDPEAAQAFLGLDGPSLDEASLWRDIPLSGGEATPRAGSRDIQAGAGILSLVGSLMTTGTLESTLQTILAELETLCGATISAILVLDEDATHLYFKALRGYDPSVKDIIRPDVAADVSIVAWVARNGQAYYAPDVQKDPLYLAGNDRVRCEACFPLLMDGRVFGVLNVESDRVDAFPSPVRAVMEAYAALAALAIHRVQREEDLRLLAHTDPLTGLANRRAFWDALHLETARAVRYRRPVSLIVIEADHFKAVNDRYGHLTGDDLLRRIGHALRSLCRQTDVPARTGGDEYAVLLPETSLTQAQELAKRLSAEIPADDLVRSFGVTLSMGVATLAKGAESAEALFDAADQAMYRLKRLGGNGIRLADF